MVNVLLPMAGSSNFFDPKLYPYPIPLVELAGRPIIEHVIKNLSEIGDDCRFFFVVKSEECRRFHLDNTLTLLAPEGSVVVRLDGETRGALCSALMAISHINNEMPLIVANSDQIFEGVLPDLVKELRSGGADAGCLCFKSVHPRWSYVRIVDGKVVEAAEKKPISHDAIAGFYYFSSGKVFVEAAMRTILNDTAVDGRYFVAPVFNELILEGKLIHAVMVPDGKYHSFFTPQRIEEYERASRVGLA